MLEKVKTLYWKARYYLRKFRLKVASVICMSLWVVIAPFMVATILIDLFMHKELRYMGNNALFDRYAESLRDPILEKLDNLWDRIAGF